MNETTKPKSRRKLTIKQLLKKFPEIRDHSINENCLQDFCCPECGNRDEFKIVMSSLFTLMDDGTDSYEDTEWGDRSFCRCAHCDHEGKARDFQFKGLDDEIAEIQEANRPRD